VFLRAGTMNTQRAAVRPIRRSYRKKHPPQDNRGRVLREVAAEDRNIRIDVRYAARTAEQYPALAKELAALQPRTRAFLKPRVAKIARR
jgi:hypothetical protein